LGEGHDAELRDDVALVVPALEIDQDRSRLLEAEASALLVAAVVLEAAEVAERQRLGGGIAVAAQDEQRQIVGVARGAGLALEVEDVGEAGEGLPFEGVVAGLAVLAERLLV